MFDQHVAPPKRAKVKTNSGKRGDTAKLFQGMQPGDSVFFAFDDHVTTHKANLSRHYRSFLRVCEKQGWVGTSQKRTENGKIGLRLWRLS